MIKLTKVSKKFDAQEVINNISLEIKQGEIIGLLGPNGAGKTTTIRMIAGVLPPSSGKIFINKKNIFPADLSTVKKPDIGYLPENNPIYDDITVEEYLQLWADIKKIPEFEKDEKIENAVKDCGLEEVYYRPISELSKGFRQRTGLAQAILSEPEILLLDEPTEGLDPNQRRDIHKLIKGIGKKRTVIISSHVLPEMTRMCKRVIIMNKGKIAADSLTNKLELISNGKQIYKITTKNGSIKKDLETLKIKLDLTKEKNGTETIWILTTKEKKDLRSNIFKLAVKNKWQLLELSRSQEDLEDIFADLTK